MTAIVDQDSPEATLGADESIKKTQVATDRTQNANPISLSFSNINYSITTYDKKSKETTTKSILKNISGQAAAGSLVAIMGPTGSGKTSLLNVLAHRCPVVKGASLTGSLLVNNSKVDPKAFSHLTSYVQQDDAMFSALTVKETLMTAAHFQLPSSVTQSEKDDYVDSIINELGLNKCRDTIIGDAKERGVSGGERKRANIGVELIKNPSCMFLDEPTSGLDSFQAQSVMGAMRDLASHGRTVIASIHQPRSSIYKMFDQLLLISEGSCIYYGSADNAVAYFSDRGHPCPTLYNPADYFMDVVSPDYRSKTLEVSSLARVKDLAAAWVSSPKSGSSPDLEEGAIAHPAPEGKTFKIQSSWFRQFQLCFRRAFITLKRSKMATIGKVVGGIFFGLILGALYSESGYNQKSIQDRTGLLFFLTINQTFGNMIGVLNSFTNEKVVVERERASNSYHVSAFYLSKFFAEIPFNMLGPIFTGSIVFWMAGLGAGSVMNFVVFLLMLIAIGFVAIGLGMIIACLAPDVETAISLGPISVVLMILFGGFYINIESLPVWLQWVQYLSLMRFAFEGLAKNEFDSVTFTCDDVRPGQVCVETGKEVLDKLSFTMSVPQVFLYLLIFMCVEHCLAFYLLEKNKRRYMEIDTKKVD